MWSLRSLRDAGSVTNTCCLPLLMTMNCNEYSVNTYEAKSKILDIVIVFFICQVNFMFHYISDSRNCRKKGALSSEGDVHRRQAEGAARADIDLRAGGSSRPTQSASDGQTLAG